MNYKMKTGTHISIPLKYDLLLNQEIILLNEIKKISKNELINLIHSADFSYSYNYQPILFNLKYIDRDKYYGYINNEIDNNFKSPKALKYDKQEIKDIAHVGTDKCESLSKLINNEYVQNINREYRTYFKKVQDRIYNDLYNSILCIPNIEGTSRLYIRCEKRTIDKKELAKQLEAYFNLPLAVRELYIFMNNPIIKELLDEINNPKANREVFLKRKNSLIPSQKHSYFKIVEGDTVKYLDLNNKKLDKKSILSSKNNDMFITKEITVDNNQLFFECLKYFVNRIFLVSNEDNLFTISGTERDIFFFQKMIS